MLSKPLVLWFRTESANLDMKVITFFFEIAFLSCVSGYMSSEDLKFCVFVGDFEIRTLTGSIKERSEKMLFSVVVNFEKLNSLVANLPSKTTIVTSQRISKVNSLHSKRGDLLWVAIPDLKNFSTDWNFISVKSTSYLGQENSRCGSEVIIGVWTENGICDNFTGKEIFNKTDCYHYQLMGMLGQRLNFTARAVDLDDKRYPYLFPNGTHTGLFRMVVDQNVDVSCGSFVVTAKRTYEYDFLWPTFFLDTMMYLRREQDQNPWSSFSKPFETDVWAAIFLYVILSGIIRYILKIFLFNFKETKAGLYNSFLLSLQIFCNQAPGYVPNRISIRLVHLFSLMAIVVLYPVYSGSIVSFLTVNIPRFPFRDFEGFVADQRYTLLTWRGDFLTYLYYFEMGDDWVGKKLLAGIDNLPADVEGGMKRLCREKYLAYADSKQNLADFMDALECDIIEVPKRISALYMGMIIDQNLPCRDSLFSGLRYLHSTGIVKRMQLELVPALAFVKLQAIRSGIRPITIAEIYPCLVLLALGLWAAIFIFLFEIYFRKRHRKKKRITRRKSIAFVRCRILPDKNALIM